MFLLICKLYICIQNVFGHIFYRSRLHLYWQFWQFEVRKLAYMLILAAGGMIPYLSSFNNEYLKLPWFDILWKEIGAAANVHPRGCLLLNIRYEKTKMQWYSKSGQNESLKRGRATLELRLCQKTVEYLLFGSRKRRSNKKKNPKRLHFSLMVWLVVAFLLSCDTP